MHWATPQERRNLGQARRKQVGRQEHNELKPKARQTLRPRAAARSMRGRVPALIKLKYQLMAESPFGYFRGAVPVMAADLAVLPSTGIVCQLCGDAHVRNLGAYAAPDGRLTFDINDFDETIRGPFEWDLKRMAASLVLAGRGSGHKEASARHRGKIRCPLRRADARLRQDALLEVGRFQVHRLGQVEPVLDALLKAERATPLHTLDQLTEPCIQQAQCAPPLSRRSSPRSPASPAQLRPRPFWPRSALIAKCSSRSASICSLFIARWMWPSKSSAPARWACATTASTSRATARRPALFADQGGAGLRLRALSARRRSRPTTTASASPKVRKAMQVQSDPFLGWTHFAGRDYLVRQLNDHKGFHRFRGPGRRRPGGLRRGLRRAARPRPRPLRRPARFCRLHRLRRRLRRGSGQSSAPPTPTRRKRIGMS
jgi:hypothetical protein